MSTNPWRWHRYVRGFSRRSGLYCPYEESPYEESLYESGKRKRRRKASRSEGWDTREDLLGLLLLLGFLGLLAFFIYVLR